MAGRRRYPVMGSANPRRAASTGRSGAGAICRQADAPVGPAPTASSPCPGRRPEPVCTSGHPRVDILVLVAGRRSAARRGGQSRQGRTDAGGPFVRRMVCVGEARRGASPGMSCRRPGRLCRSRGRQGCRGRRADCRGGDGVAAVIGRPRPSDLLRVVCPGQHRPDPGPGPCPSFRHGGTSCARPGRRCQRRPLGRVGGGRDQVADDADRCRRGHALP